LLSFYYKELGYGDRLSFPPIGLGYLAQYLENKGIKVSVVDMGRGLSLRIQKNLSVVR